MIIPLLIETKFVIHVFGKSAKCNPWTASDLHVNVHRFNLLIISMHNHCSLMARILPAARERAHWNYYFALNFINSCWLYFVMMTINFIINSTLDRCWLYLWKWLWVQGHDSVHWVTWKGAGYLNQILFSFQSQMGCSQSSRRCRLSFRGCHQWTRECCQSSILLQWLARSTQWLATPLDDWEQPLGDSVQMVSVQILLLRIKFVQCSNLIEYSNR